MQPGPDLLENMMVKLSVCAVIGGFRSSAFCQKKKFFLTIILRILLKFGFFSFRAILGGN